MTSAKAAAHEYAGSTVPASAVVSGWQVAITKLGVVVALPGFVMGAQVGTTLGLKAGALSMALGGVVLMVMGSLTGAVAVRSRLSTSLITQFAFGRRGGRLVNAVLAITLLGWFGVTAEIFADSVKGIVTSLDLAAWPVQTYAVLGGALMVVTTIYGFSALRRLSDVTIPLLLITLLVATYQSLQSSSLGELAARPGTRSDLTLGISAVVGGLSAGICVFPDLCRFARNPAHAFLAAALTYAVGLPVVLALAAIISVGAGSQDLITILITLGLGIPALLLLVFKAWTTNAGNLYSASLGLATIFPGPSRTVLVIAAGSIGILLSALGITAFLIPFLLLLSITIPPIAGIYVADFFLVRAQQYDLDRLAQEPAASVPAFAAWIAGVAIAAATSGKLFTLTGMPAADSIASSSLLYLLLAKYMSPRLGAAASARR
jgi:cytosine permease